MGNSILSDLVGTLKSSFRVNRATFDASGLSAARSITLPDASFTVAGYVSATQRVLGRNTAGAGNAEEVTLSQALDWVGSTRGTILYRGASGWAALAPGTAGQVLQSGGSTADPSWTNMATDLSTYHLISAASVNATNIKASAAKLFGWFIANTNAAARKVAFHNTAGTPTAGASVFMSLLIPGGGAANVLSGDPINFTTGLAITTTTGVTDSDNVAVAANDLVINLFYT